MNAHSETYLHALTHGDPFAVFLAVWFLFWLYMIKIGFFRGGAS